MPQALEGVAAAGLLCAAVRRAVRRAAGGTAGAVAGLIAGAAMALTPAAVLIFRFDNPDALMVLLIVVAAYCVIRALEGGRTWWLVGAGVAFGFGFLTKSGARRHHLLHRRRRHRRRSRRPGLVQPDHCLG